MRLRNMQGTAAVALLVLSGTIQPAMAQTATVEAAGQGDVAQTSATRPATATVTAADQSNLPQTPEPKSAEPLYLRDTVKDYTQLHGFFPNPLRMYTPTDVPEARLGNTPRLSSLVRDGKIYLSLSDAVLLALENNFDIAIARINLDIADTDILRAKAGLNLRGVSTGLVTNTLGGSGTTVTGGGGPGGTSNGSGGGGAGAGGLVLSTNGGGPAPETLDPYLTGTTQFERATSQQTSPFSPGAETNTFTSNFGYQQGFLTGTQLGVTFNNSRQSTTSTFSTYSPLLDTAFRAQVTQHLLQGFGTGINGRFIVQAKNNRRITDSAFRQQVLYTVNQVEDIYWGLVSAYEDEQAKERALGQSTQLTNDNRKQLQIGTLAPLDVVNSDSEVATDREALVASKSNLEYQQLVMKQAIARNLQDPTLTDAPVIPTDRVGLDRLPEEDMPVEDLVKQAYANNPQIEQAVLTMKNNEITIKAEKNGLLPVIDAYGFYGTSSVAGPLNPSATPICFTPPCSAPTSTIPGGYGGALSNLFTAAYPDYGAGVNINIPLRNRGAQADQARSQMEYRQVQMRVQQLYTQIRIQVINEQYALTNDRAQVKAAEAGQEYAAQSLDAEQKKLKLGASTSALVLAQQRSMAVAENALITATAVYAKDRAALRELVSDTLEQYGISVADTASGNITTAPLIPGLTAPKEPEPVKPIKIGASQ